MPDRDKETLAARNSETLLTARIPAELKRRLREAAQQDDTNVSACVIGAVEEWLNRRDSDRVGTELLKTGGRQ